MSLTNISTLGFIGLGVMGNPMCANLSRKSGLPVYGADRDADAVMRLADTPNFHDCASITEVARQADVVFLSLPAIKQVVDVCLGPGGLLQNPGRVKAIVDMSTSSVEGTRALAAKVRAAGIAYLDAPVARLREAARLGTLSIMVGGSQADFDVVRPFLATMGSDITLCGEVGAGQVVKILNNMVVFMNVHALAEALTIGRHAGVDGKLLLEAMSMGSADSFMLRNAGLKSLVPHNFPKLAFPTDYAIKDISLALELARSNGLAADAPTLTHELLCKTRDAGYALDYYPAMINLIDPSLAPKA